MTTGRSFGAVRRAASARVAGGPSSPVGRPGALQLSLAAAADLARLGDLELLGDAADAAGVLGLGESGQGIDPALEARLRAELIACVDELRRRWDAS